MQKMFCSSTKIIKNTIEKKVLYLINPARSSQTTSRESSICCLHQKTLHIWEDWQGMHKHVHIYIYIYVCAHTYTYMRIFIYSFIYIYIHSLIYIYTHMQEIYPIRNKNLRSGFVNLQNQGSSMKISRRVTPSSLRANTNGNHNLFMHKKKTLNI